MPMTEDEFLVEIERELDLQFRPKLNSRLNEDLNLDSIDMMNMIVLIEEMAMPEQSVMEQIPVLITVADAYDYLSMLQAVSAAGPG